MESSGSQATSIPGVARRPSASHRARSSRVGRVPSATFSAGKIAGVPGVTGSPLRVKSPLMNRKLSRGLGSSDITSVVTGFRSLRSSRVILAARDLKSASFGWYAAYSARLCAKVCSAHGVSRASRAVPPSATLASMLSPLIHVAIASRLPSRIRSSSARAVSSSWFDASFGGNSSVNARVPPGLLRPWPSSTVLLKNANNVLPLSADDLKAALIIGPTAKALLESSSPRMAIRSGFMAEEDRA